MHCIGQRKALTLPSHHSAFGKLEKMNQQLIETDFVDDLCANLLIDTLRQYSALVGEVLSQGRTTNLHIHDTVLDENLSNIA